MKKPFVATAMTLALAAATTLTGVAASPVASGATRPASTPDYALVQLSSKPLATAAATKPTGGKKINLRSTAVKNYKAKLAAERNAFRTWLRANAPKARISAEFDLAVNAVGVKLNGTSLAKLRSAPGVRYVERQGVFRPTAHDDPDLELVNALAGWNSAGGAANAGKGVDVAIIDSGIDVTNSCFDDAGYPAAPQIGDPALTNNKVIVNRVYGNKVVKNGLDGSDQNGHGTHVAGTVACNAHTDVDVDGVAVPYDISGVAPAARLGAYNVFPGTEGSGRSEDILEAMEDAYADGFDIANMSLGGSRHEGGFLLVNAINNLDRANMVVAVAAGNEGPGYFTVHYPGAAVRGLTAGASTVGHNVVNTVTVDGATYDAVVGEFAELDEDLTAPLKVVPGTGFPHNLSTACDGDPLPDLTGKIALLGRGTCDFTVKMRNAQNKGAVGVIMVDREEGAPFVMSHNGLEPAPTIPGYMVSLADGLVIATDDGKPATLNAEGVYKTFPDQTHMIAGFSSQGPTHGDLLIKPDAVAPGADVLSSYPAWSCDAPPCFAFLGGTSMATPHLAGAAAVVRGKHPAWTAQQVRSAIVNTAQQNLLRHPDTGVVTNDPLIVGSGLLDLGAAVTTSTVLSPVSKSFGKWSSGAGGSRSATIVVTNTTGSSASYSATVQDAAADGATFAGGGSFTLAAGESRAVTVTLSVLKRAADGHKWATLRVSRGGAEVAHAMLFTLVGEGVAAPGQHMTPPAFQ
ncbi:MAG TPA: S8 family serine peptidase [Nocardioidaceae bacterium]|nr:S8 family serine peptidase [Nocardioidaceae bacterium]